MKICCYKQIHQKFRKNLKELIKLDMKDIETPTRYNFSDTREADYNNKRCRTQAFSWN